MAIVGASFDSPEENQAWAEDEAFEYELWSDLGRELAVYYGAADDETATTPRRLTKLLDGSGTLVLEYESVSVSTHPSDVLADCEMLFQ